jgi:putative DNA primase/helicase
MKDADVSFIASQIAQQHRLVSYQEDLLAYSAGLYKLMEPGWLHHEIEQYCTGSAWPAKAADIADIARLVHFGCFRESLRRQPPFWLSTGQQANVVVVANGILTIAADGTVSLGPHTPDLFAVAGVPFPYDPAAVCPQWEEFTEWMVGAEEAELLRQFCAWVFVAHRLKLEKLLWLYGVGENGKSTWLRVVRYVLGEDSTSAVGLGAFSGAASFRMWPTLYKVANFTFDASIERVDVAALNAWVSGDPITINRKYQRQITVEPTAVGFFGSNYEPLLPDSSEALWRRLLSMECSRRPDKVDPDLINKALQQNSWVDLSM